MMIRKLALIVHDLNTPVIIGNSFELLLQVGSLCEVKHPDKKEFVEATINKIQDCSQYTVG
jgi:Ras-related protein Rab-1A